MVSETDRTERALVSLLKTLAGIYAAVVSCTLVLVRSRTALLSAALPCAHGFVGEAFAVLSLRV